MSDTPTLITMTAEEFARYRQVDGFLLAHGIGSDPAKDALVTEVLALSAQLQAETARAAVLSDDCVRLGTERDEIRRHRDWLKEQRDFYNTQADTLTQQLAAETARAAQAQEGCDKWKRLGLDDDATIGSLTRSLSGELDRLRADCREQATALSDAQQTIARLQRKIAAGPERQWVETDDPDVIACMGSAPECAENGCQADTLKAQIATLTRQGAEWQRLEGTCQYYKGTRHFGHSEHLQIDHWMNCKHCGRPKSDHDALITLMEPK